MLLHRATLVAATISLIGSTISAPTPHDHTPPAPTARASHDDTPPAPTASATAPLPAPATTPERLSAVERDAVRWAVGRFESADLELPAVAISFSADSDDCNGEQGVYRRRSGAHSIVVCVPDRDGAAIDHRRRRTLLHELAHAWDHTNLTDADRRHLQQHLGADDWYAADRQWEERPVEQLAETLTWGLFDQPRRPLLIDRPCDDVHADFRAVTGQRPLGPIEPHCEIGEPPRGGTPESRARTS